MNIKVKRIIAMLMATTVSLGIASSNVYAEVVKEKEAKEEEYEIYPKPQKMEYDIESFKISNDVNIVFESGIDIYTKNRLEEVLKTNEITFSTSTDIVDGKTNILVGINESGEVVDKYFNTNVIHEEEFFEKMDSHLVSVDDNVIGVLGDDTDSAFYGVTTLKHVFNQLNEKEIREFRVDDYSNVKHRGFIEGYYGQPWSNEDRAELMKYGGDYKLNTYFFAPKDDIYHNKKWKELYPEEELKEIKKLAKVGNETKNKYVYALHPFMYDAIKFDTEENYQRDLNIIKAKFTQLLENDVRAFSILADDAGVPPQGPSSYVKLLEDLTNWLIEQRETYPDLVIDIPFCPNDYMGNGSSSQLKEVNKAPESVSIIATGGRVWGEVSENFTSNYINNIASDGNPGRAPYMWINWPCSDNSKQHLIMGGNDKFLHPGVNPDNVQGIILNPMQQAEANKSALFAIADYGWNIWDDKEQADQNWYDSFKYMDHGTAEETDSSRALREISKHMINQNMDGRVVKLEESVELAPKITEFRKKLNNGTVTKNDTAILIKEFEALQKAAKYYKENPGNERTRDQINYWLNCWEDTTTAAINYLKCLNAVADGDNNAIWNYYSEAQAAFEKSKTYEYWYVDHYEHAEVGVQHIVPLIKNMGANLNEVVTGIIDPSKVIASYITNREDAPSGDIKNVTDNNIATEVVYKSPNNIAVGEYVGIKYNTPKHVTDIEFQLGCASNARDTFAKSKIEITEDGKTWKGLNGEIYTLPNEVIVENLDINVMGIRMIATEAKSNTWLGVKDISVNKESIGSDITNYNLTASHSENIGIRMGGTVEGIIDGNEATGPSFALAPYQGDDRDTTPKDAFIKVELESEGELGLIKFVQAEADKINKAILEYTVDGTTWIELKTYNNERVLEFDATELGIQAKALRVRNLEGTRRWWEVKEFSVQAPEKETGSVANVYTNTKNSVFSVATLEQTKLAPAKSVVLLPNEYVGVKLDRIKDLTTINNDITTDKLELQISENGVEWSVVEGNEITDARYVRLLNKTKETITFDINAFEVNSNEIYPVSYVKGHANIYNNSKAEQAFDGNFNSTVYFDKGLGKDESIVYDLGQVMDIDNLKYVVLDIDTDHVRDGKFQLSLDGETWVDAFETSRITDDKDAKPQDNGYKHGSVSNGVIPISHSYLEGENLNMKARYFRILGTETYLPRWIRISEILINNGEYVKANNNPTFVSDPIELKNYEPEKMLDGDLTTSYRPNTNGGAIISGSITYKLSEKTDVKKINIVQNGNSISNAKVMARVGKDQWEQLGVLDKSLNEILNPKYENIYEIKIEWDGIEPNIYEIVTINDYDFGPENQERPNKVSELKEVEKNKNSIKIEWKKPTNTNIDKYILYKDGKKVEETKNTNFVFDGLKENKIYGFKVIAVGVNGKESKAESITLRTAK